MTFLSLALLALIVLVPHPAHAYIDPGIVTTLFQGFFALVMGIVTAWATGAFGFFKTMFKKKNPSAPAAEHDNHPTDPS